MEKRKYKAIAWAIGLLGLWLMVAGSLVKAANGNFCNNLIAGLIVAFLGMSLGKVKELNGWLSYPFGVWMIIAACIPRFLVGSGHVWNDVIVGVLIATAGFTALGGQLSKLKSPRFYHKVK
jgi:hypothetical protein